MVKKKQRYGKLIPVSQGMIFIQWCGNTMRFSCQYLPSCIKISQITYFSGVFSAKKPLAHGETKT
jgi:hypothetical protein